ncbi:MAG: glutaredoxin [Bacteriovorax sp.]|nr:glutaredoxin [Bacteriovorax sp.]
MSAPELDLYYYDACPYCQRVLSVIKKHKIKVIYKDIYEGTANLEKLRYITGRKTTPCLFINGDPMFESFDIMAWLEKNLDKLEKTV